MPDLTHWTPESEVPPPLVAVPPPPRVPELADTEPPGPPSVHATSLSLAPEALTAALGRLASQVERSSLATEGTHDAVVHLADAFAEHIASEREWQASVEARLSVLARSSLVLPVVGVVLGGLALAVALGALLLAASGHGAAAAPPGVGAAILGGLAAFGGGRG